MRLEWTVSVEAVEFGQGNAQSILLIPGNMMSWRQFEQVIPFLADEYHVVAVSLDGFDGSSSTFTTIEDAAIKLAAFIAENLDGHIDLLFGESLGCATAASLFHGQDVQVDALILNGAQYIDFGLLNGLLARSIPKGQFRFMERAQSAEQLPWLMKLFTRTDDEALLGEFDGMAKNVTLETLENATREALRLYKALGDYAPQPGRRVSIWYGAKEPNMRKAVAALTQVWPDAQVHPFEGMGHGEIVAHPQQMADEIKRFLGTNGYGIARSVPRWEALPAGRRR